MDDLCSACFCIGRKVKDIAQSDIYKIYVEILDLDVTPFDIKHVKMQICWECETLIRKYDNFKIQVQDCYAELLHYSQDRRRRKLTPILPHLGCWKQPELIEYPPQTNNSVAPDDNTEFSIINECKKETSYGHIDSDSDGFESDSHNNEFETENKDTQNKTNNLVKAKNAHRMYAGLAVFLDDETTLNNSNFDETDIDIVLKPTAEENVLNIDTENHLKQSYNCNLEGQRIEIKDLNTTCGKKCDNKDVICDDNVVEKERNKEKRYYEVPISNINTGIVMKNKDNFDMPAKVHDEEYDDSDSDYPATETHEKYANVDIFIEPQDQDDRHFPEFDLTKIKNRPRNKHLDMETKSCIIALHKDGQSARSISRELRLAPHTVFTWIKRYKEEGITPEERMGRPSKLNDSQKQLIRDQHEKFGYVSTKNFAQLFGTSTTTIRRFLKNASIQNPTPNKKTSKVDAKVQKKDNAQKKSYAFKNVECADCGKVFKEKSTLAKHIAAQHSSNPVMYSCPHCPSKFKYESTKYNHIRICHKDKFDPSWYCVQCKRQLFSKFAYQRHVFEKHTPESGYIFECDVCNQKFVDKDSLRSHSIADHAKYYAYKCNQCEEEFQSEKSLDRHKTVQHSKKKHLCHLCAMQFKDPKHLQNHIRNIHKNNLD